MGQITVTIFVVLALFAIALLGVGAMRRKPVPVWLGASLLALLLYMWVFGPPFSASPERTGGIVNHDKTALVLIDAQVNQFDPPYQVASSEELLPRLQGLVERFRAAGVPVVFVRNCGTPGVDPDERGTPGWELHPTFVPAAGELLLDKTTLDTFESTPLETELKARGVERVVIAGVQSEYCIRETSLGAVERGFDVTLVSDGHSTLDSKTRKAAEASASVNAELAGKVKLVQAADVRPR